jgi:hypothetical protein
VELKLIIDKVWFATDQRAKSLWKMIVYDDIGPLHLEQGILDFQGRKFDFDMDDIRSVTVTPLRVAWGIMIPTILLSAVLIWCVPLPCYGFALTGGMATRVIGLTGAGLIIAGLYVFIGLRLLSAWSIPWVRIEHSTASGPVTFSYFTVCNSLGLGVLRKETLALAKRLQEDLESGQLGKRVSSRGAGSDQIKPVS